METLKAKTQIAHSAARPQVRDFISAVEYLGAHYRYKKTEDPSFSYTRWADELGLQSRVFLKLMVSGKRSITEKSIPLFIKGLKLTGPEEQYFRALARLTRATTHDERTTQLNELYRLRKNVSKAHVLLDHFRFLSSPLAMRVQSFLTFEKDPAWTPSEIATVLGASENEILSTLDLLESMTLAKMDRGGWVSTQRNFEVPTKLGDIGLQSLHRRCLDDSIKAIDLDPKTRFFQALNIFLTEEESQNLHAEIQEFTMSALARYSNLKPAGAKLFQCHFSLIPVSGTILQAERSQPAPVAHGTIADESIKTLPHYPNPPGG